MRFSFGARNRKGNGALPSQCNQQGNWSVRENSLRPVTVLLLGCTIALLLGALLSDIAYYQSFEVQWANFAAWLIAGALVTGALVVLLCVIGFFRRRTDRGRSGIVLLLVAAMWVAGL